MKAKKGKVLLKKTLPQQPKSFSRRFSNYTTSSRSDNKIEANDSQVDSQTETPLQREPDFERCKLHSKKLKYICWDHEEKICSECGLFGQHLRLKCSNIRHLDDLNKEIASRKEYCEDLLPRIQTFSDNLEKKYQEQKKDTLQLVQEKFKELSLVIAAKEREFLYEIESFYDKEMNKLHREVGEHSLAKQVITQKISEFQKITQMKKPFELLQEDISEVFSIIQKGISSDKISQIDQMLQEMKKNIDSNLSSQLVALQKMKVSAEDLNSIREEAALKVDEKLSLRQELIKYNFPLKDSLDVQSHRDSTEIIVE